jgi:hypothetical protein
MDRGDSIMRNHNCQAAGGEHGYICIEDLMGDLNEGNGEGYGYGHETCEGGHAHHAHCQDVEVVPEPNVLSLMLLGFAGLVVLRTIRQSLLEARGEA